MGIMGWQILILLIPFASIFLVFVLTPTNTGLTRREFVVRCLAILGTSIVLGGVSVLFPEGNPVLVLITLVVWLGVICYSFRIQILRLQDIGRSRYFVLLGLVPIVNLIMLLFLLFAPSASREVSGA